MESSEKSPEAALEKLRQLCSRQEKCTADVITLLKKWGTELPLQTRIVDQLKAERFIDDYRYALAFVKDKIRFDHWGIIKIRYLLHHKGLSKTEVEKAIAEINKEEYRCMIGKEMDKKRKSLKGNPREIWAKMARFGTSRGYEMEYVREFLGDTTEE